MDDLIFKLERVVQTKGSEPLEDFEGPLDFVRKTAGLSDKVKGSLK